MVASSVFALALALLVLSTGVFYVFPPMYWEVREFEQRFERVRLGDKKSHVVGMLGRPDERNPEFRLGQFERFEDAYERAQESTSKYYLLWYRGWEMVYTIGFDKKNEVQIIECGGT